jgi:hypothetical protein
MLVVLDSYDSTPKYSHIESGRLKEKLATIFSIV